MFSVAGNTHFRLDAVVEGTEGIVGNRPVEARAKPAPHLEIFRMQAEPTSIVMERRAARAPAVAEDNVNGMLAHGLDARA